MPFVPAGILTVISQLKVSKIWKGNQHNKIILKTTHTESSISDSWSGFLMTGGIMNFQNPWALATFLEEDKPSIILMSKQKLMTWSFNFWKSITWYKTIGEKLKINYRNFTPFAPLDPYISILSVLSCYMVLLLTNRTAGRTAINSLNEYNQKKKTRKYQKLQNGL